MTEKIGNPVGRNGEKWLRTREPFEEVKQVETAKGTVINTGEKYLVKPKYLSVRLPARAELIMWDPYGLPGGPNDMGEGLHKCRIRVDFRFYIPPEHEYSHMDQETRRVEGMNLDFVVGSDQEITRDRSNCNA